MSTGSTFTYTLTRDQIIEQAYKKCGVLAEGESLSAELLSDGIIALNLIVRELDAAGKWLWGIAANPTAVTLAANTWAYTSASGAIPTSILEIVSAVYRDGQGIDTPLRVLTPEGYMALADKYAIGSPQAVYLTEQDSLLGVHTLHVWPTLQAVDTQSVVTGTDAVVYRCIKSHTSVTADNKPITGTNYLQYWEAGGSGPAVWANGTSYSAPQQIRLKFKRPLYEFTSSSHNPDFPPQWTRLLVYRTASDLADDANLPSEIVGRYAQKAKGAYDDIFRTIRPTESDHHNKASYF